MTAILERARQLVALATDSGASEHEARTSAKIACDLIRKHDLFGEIFTEDDIKKAVELGFESGKRYASEQAAKLRKSADRDGRFVIRAKFSSRCFRCGTSYSAGEKIAWAPGRKALCLDCHGGES